MTVTNPRRSVTHNGNGVTTVFPVANDGPIYFLNATELVVTLIDADGTETRLMLGAGYSVSGAGNPSGGSVTTVTPPAVGQKLRIERLMPLVQPTQYPENTKFPAASHERALDRLTMVDQQQQEDLSRAPKFATGTGVTNIELPAPEDGKALKYDATSGKFINTKYDLDQLQDLSVANLDATEQAKNRAVTAEGRSLAGADRSEAARDIAAGFASDIVSQGNVPIRSTVVGVPVEIPAGINLVRLNGWNAADAPGASFKEVASEPSHAGKFQSADGRWWEIVVPAEGLDVRLVGVKADGVTDDYAAIMRADSITNKLIFPAGRIRVSQKLIPTNHPIHWKGHDKAVNRTTYSKRSTQIVGDHQDDGVLEIYSSVSSRTEFFTIEGIEITGNLSSPPDDQHGLIIRSRWHWSSLQRTTFSELTGYGIALEPGVTYAQNVRWQDISMYSCGGAVGYTSEPEDGDQDLACTQLKIINFNFDHRVKPQSPQPYLLDFRGMREITAENMVLEGVGAVGLDTIFAFATNADNRFENVHVEFTTNTPSIIAHFQRTGSKFYGAPESRTSFNSLGGIGKIKFDDGVEHLCYVNGRGWYDAPGFDALVEFADHTGSLVIDNLSAKNLVYSPPHLAGQAVIKSQRSLDVTMGMITQGATRLARWRPSMGEPTAFKNRFVSVTTTQIVSGSAVEPDNVDSRLLVYRWQGTSGNLGNVLWGIHIPDDWIVGGVYPWVTAVIRYRVEKAAGDEAVLVNALNSPHALLSRTINQRVYDDKWTTGVFSFRPDRSPANVAPGRIGAFTGPAVSRIAAFDLYLGLDWAEPLDLDAP